MNYLNYLKNINTFSNYVVTDEINYQYNGDGNALIIKYLAGVNFKDSIVQPVQLIIYTDDLPSTKTELELFASTYNNNPFYDGTDYIQQIYSTPFVLSSFESLGRNFSHQMVITGNLLISTNVRELKEIKIDNVIYETTDRTVTYSTYPDNQKIGNSQINTTNISYASVKFNCSMIHKNNVLSNKLVAMRKGFISIDTPFDIVFIFSDSNTEEVHSMKIDSYTINSQNQTLPILSLSFIK
jgi:hypothetical protein